MFGFGRGFNGKGQGLRRRHRHKHCRHHGRNFNLNYGELGKKYVVISNPDKKTVEMGIFAGSMIEVQKNERSEPNIIVGVGESRYIIPRDLAEQILIR
ncbi:MAG TPA: ferrous iron transport protein A [Candidatus Cloacimonetes bacterium]|nr:ferrous iron transport protein A [Candidatus Cloacimonadota bacterium]